MTVCNACRYCEAYCPGLPGDGRARDVLVRRLSYLANLCHNCGECLYACQYAPPHEFGIDVPRTLSKVRVESYEAAAWPALRGGRVPLAVDRGHSQRSPSAALISAGVGATHFRAAG